MPGRLKDYLGSMHVVPAVGSELGSCQESTPVQVEHCRLVVAAET